LTTKGIWATVLSLAGILAYISFRFQLSFAMGAVVATIHDLLVTFAFLAFFGYDLTLNVIAALLTDHRLPSTNDNDRDLRIRCARTCAAMRPRLPRPR
jgi:hypothetical protein